MTRQKLHASLKAFACGAGMAEAKPASRQITIASKRNIVEVAEGQLSLIDVIL